MKSTVTKSLRWTILFTLLFHIGVFSTNASAGELAPIPPNPSVRAPLFEGGGPMPTPEYPPLRLAFFEGLGRCQHRNIRHFGSLSLMDLGRCQHRNIRHFGRLSLMGPGPMPTPPTPPVHVGSTVKLP